ncbi:MAG: AAA family ATPase [Muribaculaceae bacterium]|nr:AAA family ATPase [Muribaculaceae bacterium]
MALIGENGSGKSNLFEAITLIFHGIFDKRRFVKCYQLKTLLNLVNDLKGKITKTRNESKKNQTNDCRRFSKFQTVVRSNIKSNNKLRNHGQNSNYIFN